MSGALKFGAVLAWDGFQFPDGGSSDKLLVVLGAKHGRNVIAVLATSRPHGRNAKMGCYADAGYFTVTGGGKFWFALDTWIELRRPQEISKRDIAQGMVEKKVRVVGQLPPQIANAIRNCLKQSKDVTAHQLSLLE